MSNHKATSAVIPSVALRRLLLRIEDRMRANPRLRLPYDPRAGEIWKYYGVIKVTPIVMDKMLVILMTIPVLDKSLELNIYQVHNLPAIPPGQEIAALYQLESRYFAIGKHVMYVTLPTEQSVRVCLQTELAICILEQALYPVKHITWCVYALFIDDEPRIKRDCKYTVSKVSGNKAISLGGYLWAISSIKQEQLQVRCLEETHMIEIQPPLQIVYLGNGCEGYSPSMFLPAKNEMTTHAQIESRREYFLQFNYIYTPDRYIGLWWQFRTRMMSEKEARAFITQVAPLGTMCHGCQLFICRGAHKLKTVSCIDNIYYLDLDILFVIGRDLNHKIKCRQTPRTACHKNKDTLYSNVRLANKGNFT